MHIRTIKRTESCKKLHICCVRQYFRELDDEERERQTRNNNYIVEQKFNELDSPSGIQHRSL